MAKWYRLPAEVAARPDLSRPAKVIYGVLYTLARWQVGRFPGAPEMGRLTGLPVSTVQRALAQLEERGLVTVERRGRGRCNFYRLPGVEPAGRPTRWPSTCPLAGRPLPTSGQVTCPLTVRSLPTGGQVDPGGRSVDQNRRVEERAGLSPLAIEFRDTLRSLGVRVSEKQLWQLNPVLSDGVPLGLVVEVARERWLTSPPWEIAAEAKRRWEEVVADARALGLARTRGVPAEVPAERVERVKRFGSPRHRAWAFGEGEGER